MSTTDWDKRKYHGRYNRYPFTEVVAFILGRYGSVPDRSAVRILDLGFGGGHHLRFLAQEGFDYYGADGSRESLEIANEYLGAAGFVSENLHVAPLSELPFEDAFFDCVIDRGSLVCNPVAELPGLIGEVHRVLKTDGTFFSMILNERSTVKAGARSLGEGDYTDFQGRLEDAGVLHFTDVEEAKRLYSFFEIEDIELLSRTSELHKPSPCDAWTIVTCRK